MPETTLAFALVDAAARLTRHLDSSLSMIKGVSFSEYQLLAALREHPTAAATRVDLAAAVRLSPSGVTRALKPMEKLGFVTTTRDTRDARKSLAELTPAGRELLEDAHQVVVDTIAKVGGVGDLVDDERQLLLQIFAGIGRG